MTPKTISTMMLLAALAAAPLVAQTPANDTDAPDFKIGDCLNKPAETSFEQMKGDVILIKYWGRN